MAATLQNRPKAMQIARGPSAGKVHVHSMRNQGGGPTEGDVKVEDDLPPELTATAAQGAGWNCNISDRPLVCSRSLIALIQDSCLMASV